MLWTRHSYVRYWNSTVNESHHLPFESYGHALHAPKISKTEAVDCRDPHEVEELLQRNTSQDLDDLGGIALKQLFHLMTCWWLDVTWLTYLSCLPSLLAYLAACLSRVHWGLLSYDTLMRRKLEHYVPLEIDMRSRNTGQNTWSSCCLNTDSTPYWQRNGILLRCLDLWRTGHKMKQPCS